MNFQAWLLKKVPKIFSSGTTLGPFLGPKNTGVKGVNILFILYYLLKENNNNIKVPKSQLFFNKILYRAIILFLLPTSEKVITYLNIFIFTYWDSGTFDKFPSLPYSPRLLIGPKKVPDGTQNKQLVPEGGVDG